MMHIKKEAGQISLAPQKYTSADTAKPALSKSALDETWFWKETVCLKQGKIRCGIEKKGLGKSIMLLKKGVGNSETMWFWGVGAN